MTDPLFRPRMQIDVTPVEDQEPPERDRDAAYWRAIFRDPDGGDRAGFCWTSRSHAAGAEPRERVAEALHIRATMGGLDELLADMRDFPGVELNIPSDPA